ncbi:MAG: rubredoxin-like domain-containing protein [Thermodesulfobacteriota bacterium]
MSADIEEMLLRTFGLLSKAAARKKIYAKKAVREGREGLGHLIRAISESEKVQAHRVFSAYRGHIDRSEKYLSTIFEKEIGEIIDQYSLGLDEAEKGDNQAIIHALPQLLAVEKHISKYYSAEKEDIASDRDNDYHVCSFCGYISAGDPPDSCPVCGAKRDAFKEIE